MTNSLTELQAQMRQLAREIGNRKREGCDVSTLIERHRQLGAAVDRIRAERPKGGAQDAHDGVVLEGAAEPTGGQAQRCVTHGGAEFWEAGVIDTGEQFRCLRDEWEELRQDSDSIGPFVTWEWLHTWWATFGCGRALRVLTVRDGSGRLMGIAPLMLRGRTMAFLSSEHPEGPYLDFILRRGAERQTLSCILACLRDLRSQWDTVRLVHVSAESRNAGLVHQLVGRFGLAVLVRPEAPCVYGELPERYESFVEHMPSRNMRRNVRRIQRRLAQDFGSVEWVDLRSPKETEALLRRAGELHTQRRQYQGKAGVFSDPRWLNNMREVARLFAERGWLRLKLLQLDGIDAAAQIGFVVDGAWYAFQGGWLPQYRAYDVSHSIILRCVKDGIAEGLGAFDMLGESDYKTKYFAQRRWRTTVTLFDDRSGSATKVGRQLLKDGLRPLVRRWAPWAAWCVRQLRHRGRARRLD